MNHNWYQWLWPTSLTQIGWFFIYLFVGKPEILLNKEQNYTGKERASALITETKQGGPNPTSKEPKWMFDKDHLAKT